MSASNPNPSPNLPTHPSLEQLRKQAKDLLKRHKLSDSQALSRFAQAFAKRQGKATLTDAQCVLARECGFANWAALVKYISESHPAGLAKYQKLADAVAKAYIAGDKEAIRRVNWLYGTSFLWDNDPIKMHECLPSWWAAKDRPRDLALTDAQHLVARAMGAQSWSTLVKSLASAGAGTPASAGPIFYRLNPSEDAIETRGPLGEREWDQVFSLLKQGQITGLRATGEMSNAVMRKLSTLTHLKRLWFDGVQMTDDGLLEIGRVANLELLDLSGPKSTLTDKGLAVLSDLKQLKKFQMCWPQKVTDAGAIHLEKCPNLQEVNLMGTHTGDATLRALTGKANLRNLTTGRKVTDAGVPLLHEIPAFKTWQGGYDAEGPLGLMKFMAGATRLLLDGPVTDEGLKNLTGLDGLAGLGFFWHAKAFTSMGLEPITRMGNLEFFSCDGQMADDVAMEVLSRMPRLRMLQAQGAIATDAGFQALSRSRTLQFLWGRECPNLTGPGFKALCALPELTGLGVSCAKVDDASLAALSEAAKLRDLMPQDVSDAGFKHVGRCSALENLWCMYCRDTTDAATEHLRGLNQLKMYYAGRTLITDKSLQILARLNTLEKVELWQTMSVTEPGVALLAQLPRLKDLTVSGVPSVTPGVRRHFAGHVRVML